MAMPKTVTQTETLMLGSQYWIRMPVAVRLLGSTMTYLKK